MVVGEECREGGVDCEDSMCFVLVMTLCRLGPASSGRAVGDGHTRRGGMGPKPLVFLWPEP